MVGNLDRNVGPKNRQNSIDTCLFLFVVHFFIVEDVVLVSAVGILVVVFFVLLFLLLFAFLEKKYFSSLLNGPTFKVSESVPIAGEPLLLPVKSDGEKMQT
jgi:hypothetical protein